MNQMSNMDKIRSIYQKYKRKEKVSENWINFFSSLDEEVGGVSINSKEYVNIRYGIKTFNLVDIIFTWGKFDYLNLIKIYKRFKKKIVNSGNPRVDLWRQDFQKFYGIRKKKFILISSNYNFRSEKRFEY